MPSPVSSSNPTHAQKVTTRPSSPLWGLGTRLASDVFRSSTNVGNADLELRIKINVNFILKTLCHGIRSDWYKILHGGIETHDARKVEVR